MALRDDMQVVVFMGGLGTRLGVAYRDAPKSMVDVHGKPFFHYPLQVLKRQGFRRFVFCVGFKADPIQKYFEDGKKYQIQIRYVHDGEQPVGTGGALKRALPLLDENVMAIYGDSYIDFEYTKLIDQYDHLKRSDDIAAVMSVMKNKGRWGKSNASLKANGRLRYDKGHPSADMEYIDFGATVLNKQAVANRLQDGYCDLADTYKELGDQDRLGGFEVKERFYDIGTPESLQEFRNFITGEKKP